MNEKQWCLNNLKIGDILNEYTITALPKNLDFLVAMKFPNRISVVYIKYVDFYDEVISSS